MKISSNVTFINHDIAWLMLNDMNQTNHFTKYTGCIKIGNNVLIGSSTIILPNIKIGNNVVIGAGSIITKDIPDGVVAAGVPCRPVGSFEQFVTKRKMQKYNTNGNVEEMWSAFEHGNHIEEEKNE